MYQILLLDMKLLKWNKYCDQYNARMSPANCCVQRGRWRCSVVGGPAHRAVRPLLGWAAALQDGEAGQPGQVGPLLQQGIAPCKLGGVRWIKVTVMVVGWLHAAAVVFSAVSSSGAAGPSLSTATPARWRRGRGSSPDPGQTNICSKVFVIIKKKYVMKRTRS